MGARSGEGGRCAAVLGRGARAEHQTFPFDRSALAYRSFLFCLAGNAEGIEADGQEAFSIAKKYRLKLMEIFAECTLSVARVLRNPTIDRVIALGETVDRLHAIAPNALRPLFF